MKKVIYAKTKWKLEGEGIGDYGDGKSLLERDDNSRVVAPTKELAEAKEG